MIKICNNKTMVEYDYVTTHPKIDLNKSEINSLYNIAGYILFRIKAHNKSSNKFLHIYYLHIYSLYSKLLVLFF